MTRGGYGVVVVPGAAVVAGTEGGEVGGAVVTGGGKVVGGATALPTVIRTVLSGAISTPRLGSWEITRPSFESPKGTLT